jgi:hypothetical protein
MIYAITKRHYTIPGANVDIVYRGYHFAGALRQAQGLELVETAPFDPRLGIFEPFRVQEMPSRIACPL